ncbi:MAG: cell division protein SepF [Clostridiales bacterium]|nr:cell division protein SepF [Clostridiales bacterium]
MANEDLDAFLRRASNYRGGNPEYYEDTHDSMGNYTGTRQSAPTGLHGTVFSHPTVSSSQPVQQQQQPLYTQPQYTQSSGPSPEERAARMERDLSNPPKFQHYDVPPPPEQRSVPLPKVDQYIAPRMYQNMVIYSPKTSNDVERLIDYLRRREPAIINLDPIADDPIAQRVLDFTSGAVYALGGRIVGIRDNMFLIVPDGIEIATPESGE